MEKRLFYSSKIQVARSAEISDKVYWDLCVSRESGSVRMYTDWAKQILP